MQTFPILGVHPLFSYLFTLNFMYISLWTSHQKPYWNESVYRIGFFSVYATWLWSAGINYKVQSSGLSPQISLHQATNVDLRIWVTQVQIGAEPQTHMVAKPQFPILKIENIDDVQHKTEELAGKINLLQNWDF